KPNQIMITGLQPGVAKMTLTDADDKDEEFQVVVEVDLEFLKDRLRRAVPYANIQPIPGGNGAGILTGHLDRAEDIPGALEPARSVVGDRIINALRVGGVQQVQLDVIVAQVSRSELRQMSFAFFNSGQKHFLASTLGLTEAAAANANV